VVYLLLIAAAAALLVAIAGLSSVTWRFWKLLRTSEVPDRIHPTCIGVAMAVGCLSLAGVFVSVLTDQPGLARTFVHTALWGFIVATFVTVAHRMGRDLSGRPPLRAYVVNLLGSLAGVAAFALVSWLQLPPSVWFGFTSSGKSRVS